MSETNPAYTVRGVTFEEVEPLWRQAWPETEDILPWNRSRWLSGTDPNIPYGKVYYYGVFSDDVLAGVNSIYMGAEQNILRTRGLFVLPHYRQKGIARQLICTINGYARALNCSFVWGYPRESTMGLWAQCGWQQVGHPFNTMEYGPHVWACLINPPPITE